MPHIVDPRILSHSVRLELQELVRSNNYRINILGLIASNSRPSQIYAQYTKEACQEVGINFILKETAKTKLEKVLTEANSDPNIHGIMIYYPVFGTGQDSYLKDLIDYKKDLEGLGLYWIKKLYNAKRDCAYAKCLEEIKEILPCTPLAILKILQELKVYNLKDEKLPLKGKTFSVFNRSEVVGRPLAYLLSHAGATVHSFDIDGAQTFLNHEILENGITRESALKNSDVIITGVPDPKFTLIKKQEINLDSICINFSTLQNFEDDVYESTKYFIPRVGPMTVSMCLKNAVNLYTNYQITTGK